MILLIIIPVYISLNLYILHRVHKWLTACSDIYCSCRYPAAGTEENTGENT